MKNLILLIFSLICISCNIDSDEDSLPKSQFKYAEYSNWNDSSKQKHEWEIKAFLIKRFDKGEIFIYYGYFVESPVCYA